MNWDQIEGPGSNSRTNVKQQWGKLTDNQLDVTAGKIQEIYGITEDAAEKQLSDWQTMQPRPTS